MTMRAGGRDQDSAVSARVRREGDVDSTVSWLIVNVPS